MEFQTELLSKKSALDEGVLLDDVDDLIAPFKQGLPCASKI
jgi:hypothetical protein